MEYAERLLVALNREVMDIVTDATASLNQDLAVLTQQLNEAHVATATVHAELDQYKSESSELVDSLNQVIIQLRDRITVLEARIEELEPPASLPSEGLPFTVPSDILKSKKKVFAHYFGPYPRSFSNAANETVDTYTNVYNNPARTDVYNGKTWESFGGFFRNRPMFRAQRPIGVDFRYEDAVWDIKTAAAAGIDGFVVDMLGLSGSNYDNYIRLRNAAHDLNMGFYVVPMIDANGATGAAPAEVAAQKVAEFAGKNGSYYLPDGRYVFSCFGVENKPVDWWRGVISALKTNHGIDAAFINVAINWNATPGYDAISYGTGSWGYGADPNIIRSAADQAAQARTRGKVFMAPVAGQDCRPRDSLFDEACNTEALRAAWEKVIAQDAEYVQIVTWSDYSENTEFAPSTARGYVPLDLSAWYIIQHKTGKQPEVLRDVLYLSHRDNPVASKPLNPAQTRVMAHWPRGSRSALRDTVEVVSILTAPAEVKITVGNQVHTYTAPAGMSAKLVPLGIGNIAAQASRDGKPIAYIASPIPVVERPYVDDKQYFAYSSLRGTAGQTRHPGP